MSSSGWLSSVANLLVFFRWLAVWLNIVLLGISLIPFTIYNVCFFGVTGAAAIYNVTVAIVQHREKKRMTLGVAPVPSLAVIILDYLFGLLYLAAWVLSFFILFNSDRYSSYADYGRYNSYNCYYGPSVFQAYTAVGALVAVHFHMFLAAVSTHIRRQQARGHNIALNTTYIVGDTKSASVRRVDVKDAGVREADVEHKA